MAFKLNQILNMTKRELQQLSRGDLGEAYHTIRKITNSRINTFNKHGIRDVVPEGIRQGLGSAKGQTNAELIESMREARGWLRGSRSKYSGYMKAKEHFRKEMQEAVPQLDLSTPELLDDYGEFMGEMADRYGEMWHGISTQVQDIYGELMEMNKDPYEFMRNYDYWADQITDINESRKATGKRGRLSTKPSTYFNKLKKGKIK